MKVFLTTFFLTTTPLAALAEGFVPVQDKGRFLSLIDGKELRHFFYGIRLRVLPEGTIEGSAIGWDVTGTWRWQDGYFCRELRWGDDPIPDNCQLVEVDGGGRLRFTVDQGAGDSATFRLQ